MQKGKLAFFYVSVSAPLFCLCALITYICSNQIHVIVFVKIEIEMID